MSSQMGSHIITAYEIEQIKLLGYTLEYTPPPVAEELLMTNFTGLSPFMFAESIEELLGGLSGTDIYRKIALTKHPPTLEFMLWSKDYMDGSTGLLFKRTFSREYKILTVEHNYLVLPKLYRGKEIGKKVLEVCLDQYVKMGVQKIYVHAGLEDGGYVWARAGFRANQKSEVDIILNTAKNAKLAPDILMVVQGWYDYHYNNFPHLAFRIEEWARIEDMQPILKKSDWHGEIDLTNSDELINFTRYVSRAPRV